MQSTSATLQGASIYYIFLILNFHPLEAQRGERGEEDETPPDQTDETWTPSIHCLTGDSHPEQNQRCRQDHGTELRELGR